MSDVVTESQFYMWRTLFAVAHADNVVTEDEISSIMRMLDEVSFSQEQAAVLKDDIVKAQDVVEMFKGVTEQGDRFKFFEFARELVWADGDFDEKEQSVMINLYKQQMKDTTVDALVGSVSLELEGEEQAQKATVVIKTHTPSQPQETKGVSVISSFKERFLNK